MLDDPQRAETLRKTVAYCDTCWSGNSGGLSVEPDLASKTRRERRERLTFASKRIKRSLRFRSRPVILTLRNGCPFLSRPD